MDERREHKRVPVDLLFMFELLNCAEVDEVTVHGMGTAFIKDISLGGARIRTMGQQLPKGCDLAINLSPLRGGETIDLKIEALRQHASQFPDDWDPGEMVREWAAEQLG